jgi:gamma-glutamyltranspeptidase/glutathione hydrolase
MRRVAVAAGSELAAAGGATAADHGGNAVDAALAAVLVSMCTEPGIIAPGASGFISIWPADRDPVVIDAYAEMPGRGLPAERLGRGGLPVEMGYGGGMSTIVGWGSVATPGAIAGFELASREFGALRWAELLAPAITATRDGFPISGASAEYLDYAHRAIFGWDAASRAVTHRPDGTPVQLGDVVAMPELAATLELIAAEGAAEMYRGSLAERMAGAALDADGILTREDLAAYEPIIREPVVVAEDGWLIATNPAPAVGGVAMAAMLLLLRDPPFEGWTPNGTRRAARTQRAVLRYRANALDDYEGRGAAAARLLQLAEVGDISVLLRSPSTVHVSAVDSDGTACAVTVSAGYGSGAMVPGTQMWMNNSLGELELARDGFHALEPGTRLVSNMAPTVARRPDGSVLAVGTPGADRITTALSSVLVNFLHLGMSLRDAVAHPRLHVETFGGTPTIAFEPGLPVEPFDDMEVRRFPDLSMYFGGVAATVWDPVAGLFAAADPRRSGGTARGGIA